MSLNSTTRSPSAIQLTADLFAIFVVYALYVVLSWETKPAPSDGMFYIDAAHGIATGTFEGPTPINPYHHYLRWPVNLPLALMYKFFGVSAFARCMYQFLYLFGLGLLAYLLVYHNSGSRRASLAASLIGVIMPTGIFLPFVRSELPAAFWFMAALASSYVLRKRAWFGKYHNTYCYLLSGMCMALSINATMISLYAVPILLLIMYLLLPKPRDLLPFVQSASYVLLGCFGVYLLIMFIEELVLGSFFIQFRVLRWWVFTDVVRTPWQLIMELFDASNEYRFLFGFCLAISRMAPLLVGVFLLLLVATLAISSRATTTSSIGRRVHQFSGSHPFLFSGLVALILWELTGALVMVKITRYLVIPLSLLTLWLLPRIVELYGSNNRKGLRRPGLLSIAAGLLMLLHLAQQLQGVRQQSRMALFGSQAIELIVQDAQHRGLSPQGIEIYFENHGRPGLTYWPWQANIYSHYWLQDATYKLSKLPESPPQPGITAYYVGEGIFPKSLAKNGFKKLEYSNPIHPKGIDLPIVYYAYTPLSGLTVG